MHHKITHFHVLHIYVSVEGEIKIIVLISFKIFIFLSNVEISYNLDVYNNKYEAPRTLLFKTKTNG